MKLADVLNRIEQRLNIRIETNPGVIYHVGGLFGLFCSGLYFNPDKFTSFAQLSGFSEMILLNTSMWPKSEVEQIGVVLHELSHATGRGSRLNRIKIATPTRCEREVSFEEIIAENTAKNLMQHFGLSTPDILKKSLEYINLHWTKLILIGLSDDQIRAKIDVESQKAFDFILLNVLDNMESEKVAA